MAPKLRVVWERWARQEAVFVLRCGGGEERLDANEKEVLGEWQLVQGSYRVSKGSCDRFLNPSCFPDAVSSPPPPGECSLLQVEHGEDG